MTNQSKENNIKDKIEREKFLKYTKKILNLLNNNWVQISEIYEKLTGTILGEKATPEQIYIHQSLFSYVKVGIVVKRERKLGELETARAKKQNPNLRQYSELFVTEYSVNKDFDSSKIKDEATRKVIIEILGK